jgi:ribosomal protein S18 acetylase RimI-like enzyme
VRATEPEVRVRRAEPGDAQAVAELIHASAGTLYDRFVGGRDRSLRILRRAFTTSGTSASAEVTWVAELDGGVVAAMAAFPVRETPRRSRALLMLTLRSSPPWRWPRSLRLYLAGAHAAPPPPGASLYVDALATDPAARRQGVATALLRAAEARARALGLASVALDTALDNTAARSLYAAAGFEEISARSGTGGMPGFVALVRLLEPR